jgi:hypothetical protein
MGRNTEKHAKRETSTVGPGLRREIFKKWKMRQILCMNLNMVRNSEK